MDLATLKIGYVPHDRDLMLPGDRRRFVHYASARGIKFEVANPATSYDIVVLTERADLGLWLRSRSKSGKFVFDLIDSYLAAPDRAFKTRFRGLAKFFAGENRYLDLDYKAAARRMCGVSDAVVCTTQEQRTQIREHCENVHVVLDFQDELVRNVKQSYEAGPEFMFVWEGLPYNLYTLESLSAVFRRVGLRRPVSMHVLTDLEFRPIMGKFGRASSRRVLSGMFDRCHLYEWNEALFSRIATGCDLAVIPLQMDDPMSAGKPENKLLLFWRMGIPAVVSNTPAYGRAMEACGLDMACTTEDDWERVIARYMDDEQARADAGRRGRSYAEAHVGENKLLERWDGVFRSILT